MNPWRAINWLSGVVAGESMAGDQLAFLISNPTMIWDIFRIDTAIIVTAFLVLLFITFYATVTVQAMASVGTDVVLGIQGRYFIPISFIVFVTIKAIVNAKFNIGRIYNRMDRYISVSYVIIAIVVSLFVVIQRYYI